MTLVIRFFNGPKQVVEGDAAAYLQKGEQGATYVVVQPGEQIFPRINVVAISKDGESLNPDALPAWQG
jgi:hypothetical protein